ncbi:MAG TPA: ribosome maturation factor RimM [Actinomycetes bacterium]|nr:ribosome maturation factor RimM [Actinomycetes bacterium]
MQLVVGRISRPHGVRGEVAVQVRTDDAESRFAAGSVLQTDPAAGPLTVTAARWHQGRLLVSFAEIGDRTAAERFRGIELLVEVDSQAEPNHADGYYDQQLVGLRAVTVAGDEIGPVREVMHLPAQDVLVVAVGAGGQTLIPFVSEIVPEVDLAAGVIRVDPPPGLLDLGRAEPG